MRPAAMRPELRKMSGQQDTAEDTDNGIFLCVHVYYTVFRYAVNHYFVFAAAAAGFLRGLRARKARGGASEVPQKRGKGRERFASPAAAAIRRPVQEAVLIELPPQCLWLSDIVGQGDLCAKKEKQLVSW